MVREDKQFEVTIDTLIEYTKNIKVSLEYFIRRLDVEGHNMSWNQVLDSFTSICGQINTLMRYTREQKSLNIDNRVILPLLLTQESDMELTKLTENRVQVVNHEMVPDYLRTKPDLEIEEQEKALVTRCNAILPDQAVKQINMMNKLLDNVTGSLRLFLSRSETDWQKTAAKVAYTQSETIDLIAAVSSGKGLKNAPGIHARQMPIIDSLLSPKPADQKQNVKAPELKTSIKTGP